MSCSGGKAWYVCSKGPFRGCCSADPCNTGVCPDDDSNSNEADKPSPSPATTEPPPAEPSSVSTFSTSTSSVPSTMSTSAKTTASQSASTATSTSTAVIESIPTASSTSTSESLLPNSVSPKDSASTTQTHTGLSTASQTHSPASSSGSKPSCAQIGGVVAGIAAALILIGLLFCLIRRSRKKRNKRFTLLYWRNPAHERNEKSSSPTRSTLRNLLTSPDGRTYDSNSATSQTRETASHKDSPTDPGTGTLVSLPSPIHSHSISSTPSVTLTPLSTTLSTPSSTLLVDPTTAAAAAAAVAISSFTGPSTVPNTRSTNKGTALPRQPEPTPELSDTGFYRRRAELAAESARELINVPLSQRQRHRYSRSSPRQSQVSSNLGPSLRAPPARPIVTADGVVLATNLDCLVKGNSKNAATSDEDHVMSFMRYDAAKDSELPAYRASWWRSSTGSANATTSENISSWQEKGRERRVSGHRSKADILGGGNRVGG